jgi:hypothetical protein
MCADKNAISEIAVPARWFKYIVLGTSLYIIFALLAPFGASRFLFLGLALVAAGFIVTRPWSGLIAVISLIILQSPFPAYQGSSTDLGYNWFTINLLSVSLVHWLAAAACIAVFLSRRTHLPRKSIPAVLLLLGVLTLELVLGLFWKLDWYQYIVDVAIFIYAIAFFFTGIIVPKAVSEKITSRLLFTLPQSIAWGSIFLVVVSRWWPPVATHYDTIFVYVIGSLLICGLSVPHGIMSSPFRRFNLLTLLIYLFVKLPTMGSFMLLAIGMSLSIIILYWILGRLTRTGLRAASIAAVLILMIGFSLNYFKEVNPVTRMKIEQVTTLFTSHGDPALMRHSTGVRVLEIMNIWAELQKNPITLAFGKGAGGYFTDHAFPFPYLTESDYTLQQRIDHDFHNPHNNPGYIILKNGLAGTLIWSVMIALIALSIILKGRGEPLKFSFGLLFIANLATVYGYGVKNSLLIGLLGGLYVLYSRRSKSIKKEQQ